MTITRNDLKRALEYAERVKITAEIDPSDKRLVQFDWSEPIPPDLSEEAAEYLELSLQYYQRTVFTGEYLMEDDDPPARASGNRIDDVNFYLDHYKQKLFSEISKSFGLDEMSKKRKTDDGRIMTPYVEAMLAYQKRIRSKKS